MIQVETITVSGAAGEAGAATASAQTVGLLSGVIYSVYLSYQDSPPAGTTVTIEGVHTPKQQVLTITGNTDGWVHVLHPAASSADGSAFTDLGQLVAIHDQVKVTMASANAGDGVVVTLLYEVVK